VKQRLALGGTPDDLSAAERRAAIAVHEKSGMRMFLGFLLFSFALATHEADNVRRKAFVHLKFPEKNPALGGKRGRFKEA
jgi:hypothetical protein